MAWWKRSQTWACHRQVKDSIWFWRPCSRGGAKPGGDPQGQAEEGDGTEAIGMGMGTMKAQIVIELSVGGEPVRPPVGEQRILGELGGDGGARKLPQRPPGKERALRI